MMSEVSISAAREALDNMDDYARMAAGVNPIGPRGVLEQFIAAVERAQAAPAPEGDLPQPFAGAVTLLETIAAHGAEAKFDDGSATPNALLCQRFANELKSYAAATRPSAPATHADLLEAPPMPKRRVPSYHTYNDEDIQAINAIWAERVRVALGMGREAGIEEAAQVAERCYVKDAFKFELGVEAAAAIRALATQPAASAVELSDGLDPDLHINDVFRDIPYRALLAKQAAQSPVAPPKNCRESHPGSGFCVKCSEGLYGECLYRQRQFSPVVGRDADQWQPIETAPKDGTRIQIKFKSGNTHEANWRATYGGEWHVDSYEFLPWADQQDITHWRPLLVETIDAAINSKEG